jgi:hypothetical protein
LLQVSSSSLDDEDLIDRHPVREADSDRMSKPPALTSSSFDDEDLVGRHPVP